MALLLPAATRNGSSIFQTLFISKSSQNLVTNEEEAPLVRIESPPLSKGSLYENYSMPDLFLAMCCRKKGGNLWNVWNPQTKKRTEYFLGASLVVELVLQGYIELSPTSKSRNFEVKFSEKVPDEDVLNEALKMIKGSKTTNEVLFFFIFTIPWKKGPHYTTTKLIQRAVQTSALKQHVKEGVIFDSKNYEADPELEETVISLIRSFALDEVAPGSIREMILYSIFYHVDTFSQVTFDNIWDIHKFFDDKEHAIARKNMKIFFEKYHASV